MIKFAEEMTDRELHLAVMGILGSPRNASRDSVYQHCYNFCADNGLRLYLKTVFVHTGGMGDRPRVTYMSKVGQIGEIVPSSDPNQTFSDNREIAGFKAFIKYFSPEGIDLPD
jgi:hypothetical protein